MTLIEYENRIDLTIEALTKLPHYRLDSDTNLLAEAFEIAYQHELFLIVDVPDFQQSDARFLLFTKLTKYSGALVFLAIQILAANNIMRANDFLRQRDYFNKRCGIAINHLRAPCAVVSGVRAEEGFVVSGTLTWASGYQIFDTLLVGFHSENEEFVAVVPFEAADGFEVGETAESFVGESMATVDITLENFLIPFENVVASAPIGSYSATKSISKTVHIAMYSLGLGAVKALKDPLVKETASQKLEAIKEKFMATHLGEVMDRLRIDLFSLVQEIITTGMILQGGKSVLADQELQRYYRELMMFNANGLNGTVKGLFKEKFLREVSC